MDSVIATGLATDDAGVDSFAEAAARAALGLGGAPADLALVFAGIGQPRPRRGRASRRCSERLRPQALVGCGAQGVVGDGRELEHGRRGGLGGVAPRRRAGGVPPRGDVHVRHASPLRACPSSTTRTRPSCSWTRTRSRPRRCSTSSREDHPGLPVLGGLAARGTRPGRESLMCDEELVRVGRRRRDARPAWTCARACRRARAPIGPEMAITAAEGNVIHELASRPALERLKTAIDDLDELERALAVQGLLIGIVIDENRPEYLRGDFLVRGLLGADEETGAITRRRARARRARPCACTCATAHRPTRTCARRWPARGRPAGPPAGALLFTCNGRGSNMFAAPDHDAAALEHAFGEAPAAGFFCAGEIGPVGGAQLRARLHRHAGGLRELDGVDRSRPLRAPAGGPPRAAPARAAPTGESSSSSPAGGPTSCTPTAARFGVRAAAARSPAGR